MDFSTMTNKEVISWLTELRKNNEEITLDLLKEILDSRSVVDPVASTDAVTIFYSGEPEKMINEIELVDIDTKEKLTQLI